MGKYYETIMAKYTRAPSLNMVINCFAAGEIFFLKLPLIYPHNRDTETTSLYSLNKNDFSIIASSFHDLLQSQRQQLPTESQDW